MLGIGRLLLRDESVLFALAKWHTDNDKKVLHAGSTTTTNKDSHYFSYPSLCNVRHKRPVERAGRIETGDGGSRKNPQVERRASMDVTCFHL